MDGAAANVAYRGISGGSGPGRPASNGSGVPGKKYPHIKDLQAKGSTEYVDVHMPVCSISFLSWTSSIS